MTHLLGQLYQNRRLVIVLVKKDLVGAYRNTYFGPFWNILAPMIYVLLIYFVMNSISKGVIENYWAFLFSGVFIFRMMSSGITAGASCITSNANLIKKKYFQREVLVFASCISLFIKLIISYALVIVVFGIVWKINWLCVLIYFPYMLTISFIFTYGCALFFSSICTMWRDIQHAVQAASSVLLWATPVIYSIDQIGRLGALMWYNPITYFVETFHSVLYYGQSPPLYYLFMCFILACISLVVGQLIFNKYKMYFAEMI